jgi:archaeal cell division control protein 6
MEFFSFMLHYPEKMAQRIIVTGDVGTGKTALTQHFGAKLTSEAKKQAIKFHYIHVNSREYSGSLALILYRAVAVFRPTYPSRGYSAEEVLRTLLQILEEEKTHIILTLDEFDSVIEKEGSDAVYKLTRLQETQQDKPQRISFIFIMRNLSSIEKLDTSAKSTLQRNIISLEPYGKEQLIDILNDRVTMAFELGAVPEDAVLLISELAFGESGNARFAIELLWRAGKYADAEEAEMVEPECVRRAISAIIPSLRRSELAFLGLHEKFLLLGIAHYFKENSDAYASLGQLEKAYAVVCEEFDEQPRGRTQIWNYMQHLSSLSILKTEVTTASTRGRSTRISLPTIPAVELEKELRATIKKDRA